MLKFTTIQICYDFHGIGLPLTVQLQNISVNNHDVVHAFLFFLCIFFTNYWNQSDLIVSQPYSEQFALLIVLANDYDIWHFRCG